MSNLGTYGFGHLRYQEHLSAREVYGNRSIDILRLMKKAEWKDVLLLFSRMNTDIIWLVTLVARAEMIEKFYYLLVDMINVRPLQEQSSAKELLNRYHGPDYLVGEEYELDDESY